MAYLQELREKFTLADGFPASEVQLLGRSRCVVAGHKGLYSISDSEVIVRRRDCRLLILGTGLHVEGADSGEIRIDGEIRAVEFLME